MKTYSTAMYPGFPLACCCREPPGIQLPWIFLMRNELFPSPLRDRLPHFRPLSLLCTDFFLFPFASCRRPSNAKHRRYSLLGNEDFQRSVSILHSCPSEYVSTYNTSLWNTRIPHTSPSPTFQDQTPHHEHRRNVSIPSTAFFVTLDRLYVISAAFIFVIIFSGTEKTSQDKLPQVTDGRLLFAHYVFRAFIFFV